MAVEKTIGIKVDTKDAQKSVNELNNSVNNTDATIGSLTDSLDKLTGGMVSGFKSGVAGIKNAVKGFKSLKVAIAATGLGALVLVLGSVVTFFTKTQRGADLLSKATKGLGAAFGVITDRVSRFGEIVVGLFRGDGEAVSAITSFGKMVWDILGLPLKMIIDQLGTAGRILKNILTGDFKGALDEAKNGFSLMVENVQEAGDAMVSFGKSVAGVTKEIVAETKAAVALEKAQKKLEDREIAMIKTRAQTLRDVEALKLVAADQSKTTEERAEALQKAIDLEKALSNEEIAIAKERARIITEQNALGESMREDVQAQAEAEARVIELEAQRDAKLRELVGTLSGFNAQLDANTEKVDENAQAQIEAEAKLQEELSKAYDDLLQKQLSAQDQELNAVEDKYSQLLANAEKFGFDEAELTRMKNEEINSINKKYYDQDAKNKQDAEIAKLQIVAGALNGLGKLVGEQTEAGKAISAAQAIIDTYTGATKALAQGGIFGTIAAAGVVASGIASVRSIYATEVPAPKQSSVSVGGRQVGGGAAGGYSRPTSNIPRPQAVSAPMANFDTSGNLGNQIAESLQGQPMRAYVVNQDIESAQKLNRKIESTATIG